MKMSVFLKIALPVAVIIAASLFLLNSTQKEVLASQATRGTAVDAVTGSIKVHALIDIHIKSEQDGKVIEVLAEAGNMVNRGDVLAKLDRRDLEQRLNQVEIRLAAAKARSELPYQPEITRESIESDLERLERQAEFGSASQAQLEQRQRDLRSSKTALAYERIGRFEQIELLEAEAEGIKETLEKMIIRAPWDGKVAEVLSWPGEFIWRGSSVVRLVSPGRWIEMTLAEEDFYGVAPGQQAVLNLAAYPGERINAVVTRVSEIADADQKTRTAILEAKYSDEFLVPGLTGEGVLSKKVRGNTILIPRRALIGTEVYVIDSGEIEVRKVTPGFVGLQRAEILEGLEEGEWVVLEDQDLLVSGDRVETKKENTVAASMP